MIVYLVTNRENGKRYVGMTTMTLEKRKIAHLSASRTGSELPFHRAIRKYGEEGFDWSMLQECLSEDDLRAQEKFWIRELRTLGREGYNATEGGEGVFGMRHTEVTKQRMSEARKGDKNHNFGKSWGMKWNENPEKLAKFKEDRKGDGNPMFGKHHDEEARARIGAAQLKSVVQFDLQGNEVARYSSMLEAEEKTGIARQGISRCCRFPHRTAKGFKFRYAEKGGVA